jgi:hypothetical protein
MCSRCGEHIVYNPARVVPPNTPKICMQCGGLMPLPMASI